ERLRIFQFHVQCGCVVGSSPHLLAVRETFEPDMVAELGWIVRVMRVLVHHDEHVAARVVLFGLVSFVGTNDVTNDVKVRHVSSRGSAGDDEEYLLGTGTGNILEATLGSRGEAI